MPPQQPLPQPQNPYPQPGPLPTLPQPYPLTPPSTSQRKAPIALIVALVITLLMLLASVGYLLVVSGERDDYRNNVEAHVDEAVEASDRKTRAALEREFLVRERSPYRIYRGPTTYGQLQIFYPKTWSAAVDESASNNLPVNGYFHPSFVPSRRSDTAFALRVEVLEQSYRSILEDYESEARDGRVRISPYSAPKVPGVLGVRITGEIIRDMRGVLVLFPLRDKTIRISTLSPEYTDEFSSVILPNLVFAP